MFGTLCEIDLRNATCESECMEIICLKDINQSNLSSDVTVSIMVEGAGPIPIQVTVPVSICVRPLSWMITRGIMSFSASPCT